MEQPASETEENVLFKSSSESQDSNSNKDKFIVENNVRKAIFNLEVLTAKVVENKINGHQIVETLLDQLSLWRVILADILSV